MGGGEYIDKFSLTKEATKTHIFVRKNATGSMKRYLQRFSRQRDFPLTAGRRQSLDAATTHLSSFYKLCQKDMVSSRI